MPLLYPIDNLNDCHDLVICDSGISRAAHEELFQFSDEAYIVAHQPDNAFDLIAGVVDAFNGSPASGTSKIHLVLGWENILRVSSWKSAPPAAGDAFVVLKNSGVSQQDLQPFKTADISDLLPWLYYGKRFDVLRKICNAAKKQTENHLSNHNIRVVGHLIAEDSKRIIASSL